MKHIIKLLFVSILLCSQVASAEWTSTTKVKALNIGGNGLYGTFVSLENYSFSGCSATAAAFLKGSDPNYKELLLGLLSAKMEHLGVKINYSGCEGSYPLVKEIIVQ